MANSVLRGSDGKESTCNSGDLGSISGLGRSPGGGHGNPLQYSCLENHHRQEPEELQSMGSQRVGHTLATKNSSRDITANKGLYSQSYGFSSSHLWM